jgi:hypothetical protein
MVEVCSDGVSNFGLTKRLARIRDRIVAANSCDAPARADINGDNLICLAPRPECGAGGVFGGLGEGAKPDAPLFLQLHHSCIIDFCS